MSPADWSDDSWHDDDLGDPPGDDDETDTEPCEECGREISSETDVCPYCGCAQLRTASVWEHRPWWWRLLGMLGILALIASLLWFLMIF